MFGAEPTDFLASGSIEAACYRGTRLSSDDLIHAERLAGPVSDQIDAGIAFAARFMRGSDGKDTVAQYDLDVVESRGEGVRKILDAGEAHSGRRPEYALLGPELRLTLWARPPE